MVTLAIIATKDLAADNVLRNDSSSIAPTFRAAGARLAPNDKLDGNRLRRTAGDNSGYRSRQAL